LFGSEGRRRTTTTVLGIIVGLATSACFDLTFAKLERGGGGDGTPRVAWAKRAGGAGNELPPVIDVFSDSSFAAAGSFESEACVFGSGANEMTLRNTSKDDGYIARYRSSGALNWVRQLTTSSALQVTDVVGLPDLAVVATGSFEHGLSSQKETQLSSAGGSDVFLVAFEPNGDPRWAVRSGGEEDERAFAIALARRAPSRLVVAGSFVGPSTFGEDADAVELVDAAGGASQGFVVAYDGEANLVWASQTLGAAEVNDVVVRDDEVFVVGSFTGETSFGTGEDQTLTADGLTDVFFASYSLDDGHLRWVEPIGGSGDATACAIAVGDGFAVGVNYDGEVEVGSQTRSGEGTLLASFGQDRKLAWLATVTGGDAPCRDVALHADGRVTVVGQFNVQAEIEGSDGTAERLDSAAFEDGFIAHFHTGGVLAWARRVGGAGGRDEVKRVFVPTPTVMLLSGQYEDELTFGDGEPELSSAFSNGDAFFMRLTIQP
jgi:hypothetical protein